MSESSTMEPNPPPTGPSDPDSSCAYCRAYSVGTPLADELVCVCDTPCAAARCSARDDWQDCAGRCGRHVPKGSTACMDCWTMLPPNLREAITIRRGAMRGALILEARRWFERHASARPLTEPVPPPKVHATLAERGASMPAAAPIPEAGPGDQRPVPLGVDVPGDRTELARLVVRGGDVQLHEPGAPLRWHRFPGPEGMTILVLSRPRLLHENEIALDFDGKPVSDNGHDGVHVYPGARTVAEAQLAHSAWCAWRQADTESRQRKSRVTAGDVDRLRGVFDRIATSFAARNSDTPPSSHS